MAQRSMWKRGRIRDILAPLEQQILISGMSCERVDSFEYAVGETIVWVLIYEKYFCRSSSRASLTLTLVEANETVTANAMASGGGQGTFHRFSWGVEDSFAQDGWNALAALGFAELSSHSSI